MAIGPKDAVLSNLNGGLTTRPTPLLVEAGYKERMKSPALRNVDFFPTGGVAKRLGKTKQGSTVVGSSTLVSQTSESTFSAVVVAPTVTGAQAQKFVPGSSVSVVQASVKLAFSGTSATVTAYIYNDSGGSPGTSLGASNSITLSSSGTTALNNFIFLTPVPVISGTTYWLVITSYSTSVGSLVVAVNAGGSANVKTNSALGGAGVWGTTPAGNCDFYYSIYQQTATSGLNGLFDFRYGSASTQKVMAAANGNLYWNNAGTWTSLVSGLASGQDSLWSFATLKDYLFSLDNGTNQGRVWNGTAAYTTVLGYRPAGTVARSATGGTVTTGVYKVLFVTTLVSGGFRSSTEYSVTTLAANDKIAVTALAIDGTGATDFGFDIAASATKVFMTTIGGSVYYKLATGSISVARNPLNNNDTTFNITAPPAGTENTLLDEYGLSQAYFTTQIASPTGKYFSVFQNMVSMGGDAAYPSRVWFSGIADGTNLAGPQIWSTAGGLYGNYRDLNPNDGEVLVGLKEWNGNLYAFKRHSVFIIAFTENAGLPFQVRRLSGNLGALSHWSIKETPNGLVFLSERGPAICTGTDVKIIPAASGILDRFDLNNTSSYNLSSMNVTTAGNNSTKMQIHWGVSSHSATTRDITLVYDYENQAFWENDVSANYYTEVTDANFFPSVWSGDYSAQVFRHDYGTSDNGAAINFYFDTPLLQLGAAFAWKQVTQIFVAGSVQSSGTLYLDLFLDNSTTVTQTLSYDMSAASFKSGQSASCGLRAKMFRVRLRNSDLDVPVQVDSIRFGYTVQGSQY